MVMHSKVARDLSVPHFNLPDQMENFHPNPASVKGPGRAALAGPRIIDACEGRKTVHGGARRGHGGNRMKVGITEVAGRAGVSEATVSRVINRRQ
ncbi:LacI family DNA-binding transcriptional regulator, partial [Streptomyces sp. 900105755]